MKNITPREKKLIKKARVKELLEVYSSLLTDKERKILTLYTDPALSGAAIAKKLKVSRQAIHDHIRRGINKMERCETKSKLLEKRRRKMKIFLEIEGILSKKELSKEDLQTLNKLFEQLKDLD
ncbi:MAG: sigma factor-like helix-turn-helix DNA-binding protein [Caldisericum sp.]|uniref:sigma factor-like helix-turn-helix DNA-binding protein n=1 Tax=Caldisericum sp. TaxID=2499687 RepID=UPI003D0BC8C0